MAVRETGSSGFLGRLESLRGIAALSVAVSHSIIWLSIGQERAIWGRSIFEVESIQAIIACLVLAICNGAAAVNIFFVLSGFVLAKSLRDAPISLDGYIRYGVKRAFRIFPALWFSLVLVLLYLGFLFPGYVENPIASMWYNWWYKDHIGFGTVMRDVTLVSSYLNPAAWTLQVEILASLLLPLVVWCIGSRGAIRSVVVISVAVLIALGPYGVTSVFHYLYMFVVGAVISKHSTVLTSPRLVRLLVVSGVLLIFGANLFLPSDHSLLSDGVIVLGAASFILAISCGAQSRLLVLLDSRVSRFFGRISYSFYLTHFLVLYATSNLLLKYLGSDVLLRVPLLVSFFSAFSSILITIPIAMFSYRYVESPFTQLGRSIVSRSRKILPVN